MKQIKIETKLPSIEELSKLLDQQSVEISEMKRELEIEASLDKIRAQALGMNKPDDLLDICEILYLELYKMSFDELRNAMINIYEEGKTYFINYDYAPGLGKTITRMPYNLHPLIDKQVKETKNATDAFSEFSFTGKDLIEFRELRKNNGEQDDPKLDESSSLYYYFYSIGTGSIGISTYGAITHEKLGLLKRFRNVFNLSYQRYADITQAEAQTKEALLEAALEKVRSRSLAMHNSEELKDVAIVLFQQVKELGIVPWASGFNIWQEGNDSYIDWVSTPAGFLEPYKVDLTTHPVFRAVSDAKKRGEDFYVFDTSGETLSETYALLISFAPKQFEGIIASGIPFPERQVNHYVYGEQVGLMFITPEPCPEDHDIFKRFGKVFEQTYTRFLDLQKAEAQAREAQIQLALERIRARAMAMQHSIELREIAAAVHDQLQGLGFTSGFCSIVIMDRISGDMTWWMFFPGKEYPESYHMPFVEHPFYLAQLNNWKEGQKYSVIEVSGEEKKSYDKYTFSQTDFIKIPIQNQRFMMAFEKITFSNAYMKHGAFSWGVAPIDEEHSVVLQRFASVFEQCYTRFLDLQKAEAQAREAQIETALEKVRSRTMAMQSSNELQETAAVLFREFKKLGTDDMLQVTIGIYKEDERVIDFRVTSWAGGGEQENRSFEVDMDEPTVAKPAVEAWKAGKKSAVFDLTGDALLGWLDYRNKISGITINPQDTDGRRVISAAYFSKGHITISTPIQLAEQTLTTLERFAAVFDGTYTRFLDLQKAEAQARESQIEVALERVRSRTLAMQKSDELAETAAEVFKQLIALGIEPNRLYIGIIKGEEGDMEMWATDEDGTQVGKKFMFNKNENDSVRKLYVGWVTKQKSVIVNMEGKELEEYFHYLNHVMHIPFKEGLTQKRRVQSVAYFSKGFIGMASPDGQGDETILLLERFASVFNLTFTRFNDLKIAEAHADQAELDLILLKEEKKRTEEALIELQITQKQLIQSEKMASLGELTAGIAHEIQNPLNFVNNFSEVNTELLDELGEEADKGNFEEVKAIAKDIKENEQKINHHGKRADAIVKGMLQHSRSSSGVKEPTDINALADEYLRLAYHGLRAKDKSFNATLITDFDDSIGMINMIPQDIGRVILNLITNAFYAVAEKKKQIGEGYEPTVSVGTTKTAGRVEVSVKDNGNGIPQKILDKIFQPFFTTKPTGQGTGLGLSLSYDIVKAHGGELRVETEEGKGSIFGIHLPV